jgi:beta-glucanase (GH16 family)
MQLSNVKLLVVGGVVGLFGATQSAAQTESKPPWKLVWSDEFGGSRIDSKKWNVLMRETSKHNELQYYVPDEAYIENGMLRLRSRVREYGGMKFTSGRVSTDGKFAPTYGRFEIRAKLPGGKGLWPAHWLYPQNRDWAMEELMQKAVDEKRPTAIPEARPWYSEIDIMEFLGHEPSTFYGTLHYRTFGGERKTSSVTWKADFDFPKDFHVFALEWEPDAIRWYVDGNMVHTTVNGVPHTPHYIILNTAVGGDWPGNPDSSTVFPQFHDIDYVRVYQRAKPYFE